MSLANMSLDNTSHLGRPGPDELVPSRYALRVGEIDVLVRGKSGYSAPSPASRSTVRPPLPHP